MRWLFVGVIVGLNALVLAPTSWGQTPSVKEKQVIVPVVITSDGQTWVSVTNVRQPSKFKSLRLQLPVGEYEIVGRRKGFRDETRTLVVREGVAPPSVSVVCTVQSQG